MDLHTLTSPILALIAAVLVLVLPGAVWLLWSRPAGWDVLEWLSEAAGSSLSLVALAGMVLALVGASLTGFSLASIIGALLMAVVMVMVKRGWRLRFSAQTLLMLGALLALAAWRLYQVRALALPAWVDSVHHTLLVRIILERGAVPGDWLPYLPVPMFYHYGFQVSAALFSAITALEPAKTLLVFGQLVNALVAVSVYRLGKAIWGSTARAAVAGLLAGFVFQMPAYYVTWGRYPLLAGLVVLPLALAAVLEVRRNPSDRRAWGRLALYAAGVCFCHFLAVGLLALFLLVMVVFEAVKAGRSKQWGRFAWQPLAAAALGALVAAPWLGRVWAFSSGYFGVALADPFDTSQVEAVTGYLDYLFYLLGPWRGHFLLILAGLGMLLALRNRHTRLLAAWGVVMAFLATPWAPRFSPFRPDHLAIVLFLPSALLAADIMVSAGEALARVWRRTAGALGLSLAVVSLLVWGVVEGRDILNPVTIFTSAGDVSALRWIEENTPPSARFFINAVPWQGNLYRGVDGGYWITPQTGRFSLVPPLAYGWGSRDLIERTTETVRRTSQVNGCSEEFWSLVRDNELTHAYLKEGAGPLLPEALNACPGVEPVFEQDGVWIFEFK